MVLGQGRELVTSRAARFLEVRHDPPHSKIRSLPLPAPVPVAVLPLSPPDPVSHKPAFMNFK